MDEEVGRWSPDVFRLDEISAGNSLVCVAYNVFKTRNLSPAFKVSPPTFINFILAIQVYIVCIHYNILSGEFTGIEGQSGKNMCQGGKPDTGKFHSSYECMWLRL